MEILKKTFEKCRNAGRPALVTYLTAGYPSIEASVEILLGLQAGGADVIELGVPFTDPIADGPTIQRANTEALSSGVTIRVVLELVRDARSKGLTTPVLLMGYYNPFLTYGEKRLLQECKEVGINGFIVVDLPPEEAVTFRDFCAQEGLSYIPLISPATSDHRMKLLCKLADSFIYIVSRMGVTGATGTLSASLPELLARVKRYSANVPLAVGFGVSTREHFLDLAKIADAVVIGSKIIEIVSQAPAGVQAKKVQQFCAQVSGRSETSSHSITSGLTMSENTPDDLQSKNGEVRVNSTRLDGVELRQVADEDPLDVCENILPPRFGEFGGQYVPESLVDCLTQLEVGFSKVKDDADFWEEYRSYYDYIGRPSRLHLAKRLTEHTGGANIYLKREDLNHTGSHKINNALGQVLLARRLGKTEIIADTGAGQHGVATATICALFGMKCTIYMGAEDARRQALNVFRIKLLGAQVFVVEAGTKTLRDAVNEALRAWVANLDTTHFVIGSAIGPHPFPLIVRTFQSVIGNETKQQMLELTGRLPDAVVACVGGGSNAAGIFYPFSCDPSVALLGIEAAGDGLNTARHSATLTTGSKGVLHGVRTYVLQNEHGQILDTHSISAGLDYPGVGPELSFWKDSQRVTYQAASNVAALSGFRLMSQLEGIIPALESSHAIYGAIELAKSMPKGKNIVICLSGRGDKDVQNVADELPKLGPQIGWDLRF
ncbi:hypothetical protein V2G26_014755 [Clonostachys chloroleuca]|uniref:Tryptophan synthase n=1 Tax=Clonostachys chloroleuca TaxID=1926264 RepID=A0AA35PTK0_9HYPO|nr:unnamed protein product [Clonostachys chloroleuca]